MSIIISISTLLSNKWNKCIFTTNNYQNIYVVSFPFMSNLSTCKLPVNGHTTVKLLFHKEMTNPWFKEKNSEKRNWNRNWLLLLLSYFYSMHVSFIEKKRISKLSPWPWNFESSIQHIVASRQSLDTRHLISNL